MVSLRLLMGTYRGALMFVGAACLAYICTYVSLILSASFPELRFFGRYVFIIAALCIALLIMLYRRYSIPRFPSYFFILPFTIYYLVHCTYFENGALESYGISLYVIYFLGLGFWLLIKNEDDYLQILLLSWIVLFVAIASNQKT